MRWIEIFWQALSNNVQWTVDSVLFKVPIHQNYFWGLIVISLVVWLLEIAFPWRKQQAVFRKDFFLDAFYMIFNFFLFSIFIAGFYAVTEQMFAVLGASTTSLTLIDVQALGAGLQLLVFFILLDFVQWITHILLHRIPALWRFHQVHHSVKEMGFAAHLRYHWMENILYKPLKTLAVMLLGGFEPEQAYIVHFIAIAIGHLNHANLKISWGPFKYIFNNPIMHLHHHAYTLPEGKYGVNYGISLSLWDYLFKTAHLPNENGDTKLGFQGDEHFPNDFIRQNLYGFRKEK